ncbi:MAG: hypothetical protein ACWGOX_06730 [Desulforhopalus sp.]
MRRKYRNIFVFIAVMLVPAPFSCSGQVEGCATWSKQEGDSANIYLAELQNGVWDNARKITGNEGINITPTVSMAENDDIWLVWVKVAGDSRTLQYFTRQQKGEMTGKVASVEGRPGFSPSIVVDHQNTPWLSWAIDDGSDEDIYYSCWNGSGWQAPQRVHPDNTVPDITPTIGLGPNGQPWISWESFDGNEYVTRTVFWHHDAWQPFAEGSSRRTFQLLAESQRKNLPDLPHAAGDRLMGSLFMRGGGEIQSMSERIFRFKTRRSP